MKSEVFLLFLTTLLAAEHLDSDWDDPLVEAPQPQKGKPLDDIQKTIIKIRLVGIHDYSKKKKNKKNYVSENESTVLSSSLADTLENQKNEGAVSPSTLEQSDGAVLSEDSGINPEIVLPILNMTDFKQESCLSYDENSKCKLCSFGHQLDPMLSFCKLTMFAHFRFMLSGKYLSFENKVASEAIGLGFEPNPNYQSVSFQKNEKNLWRFFSVNYKLALVISPKGKPVWLDLFDGGSDEMSLFEIEHVGDRYFTIKHSVTGLYLIDYDRVSPEPGMVEVTYFQP